MANPDKRALEPGLYLIATPIGAARDITLRALDILAAADVLAAEDTRSLRKLLGIHGIALAGRPLLSYHDRNGGRMRPKLLAEIDAGRAVAYASEAGTPMISDPGFDLARDVAEGGRRLVSAPGPSAAIAALTLSGLPTDRFFFAGFLPSSAPKRRAALAALDAVPGTLIFYESPRRLAAMLADAAEALGGERPAAICREITKKFEEIRRGALKDLAAECAGGALKGEIVALVGPRSGPRAADPEALDAALRQALAEEGSVRGAADRVARDLGVGRRAAYQRALALAGRDG